MGAEVIDCKAACLQGRLFASCLYKSCLYKTNARLVLSGYGFAGGRHKGINGNYGADVVSLALVINEHYHPH
ncbi:MAG: hypothetical protein ACI8PP_000559 [Candidatus Pseudothioglobus sp.]|jgi:hypothetical protein